MTLPGCQTIKDDLDRDLNKSFNADTSTEEPTPSSTPTPEVRYPEMEKYVEMFREYIEQTDENEGVHIRNLKHHSPKRKEYRVGHIDLQYNTRGQTQWIMYQEIRIIVEGYIQTKKSGMEDYHSVEAEIFYEDEKLGHFPISSRHIKPHVEGEMSKEWAIGKVLDDLEVEE